MMLPARQKSVRQTGRTTSILRVIIPLAGLIAVCGLMLVITKTNPIQAAPPLETALPRLSATSSPTPQLLPTLTATMIEPTPTTTPLPQELLENREQTIGIIIGTFVLVIIVIGGTLTGMWARRRE